MTEGDTASTLVFHHGALGDSVIVWPILRALGPLALFAPREKARLAAAALPLVTPIDGDAPDLSRLFSPGATMEVSDDLRDRLAAAGRIISFISNGQDAWAQNVMAMAREAHLYFVDPRAMPDWDRPIVQAHLHQLHQQGLDIRPLLADRRHNPDGPVLVHPGSGGRDKCWPAERVEALVDHLIRIGRPAQLLIGPVERERIEARRLEHWRSRYEVAEPWDLSELARVMGSARVVVANDSGPAHLAAGLGVATVALFGPTDPRVWAPLGPAVSILAPEEPAPMNWLEVEPVIEAVARW
ncbi:MAG: hypothetical protein GC162_16995 [Planctomycetes bacterium]|nr:hypothetical protein [Planctomycetota bacterium]